MVYLIVFKSKVDLTTNVTSAVFIVEQVVDRWSIVLGKTGLMSTLSIVPDQPLQSAHANHGRNVPSNLGFS